MRTWSRSGLLVLLILSAGAAGTNADVQLQIKLGDAALERFNLDAAVAAYRQAHTTDPANYEASWKLARGLLDQATLAKRREDQRLLIFEAEHLARQAVRLNPGGSDGHLELAIAVGKRALFEGGKRQVELSREVRTEALATLRLDPKADLAYHVLGVWNREMAQLNFVLRKVAEVLYGRFPPASLEQSRASLQHALELAPERVAHHVELGITLQALNRRAEAEQAFARALALPKGWVTDDYYRDQARRLTTAKPATR